MLSPAKGSFQSPSARLGGVPDCKLCVAARGQNHSLRLCEEMHKHTWEAARIPESSWEGWELRKPFLVHFPLEL